jgi:hypothetical protein
MTHIHVCNLMKTGGKQLIHGIRRVQAMIQRWLVLACNIRPPVNDRNAPSMLKYAARLIKNGRAIREFVPDVC